MIKEYGTIVRTEMFDVDSPALTVETLASDVRVMDSHDGMTHVEILGDSQEAREAALKAEVIQNGRSIKVRLDGKTNGFKLFSMMRAADVTLLVKIPPHAELHIKTVSAEVEVHSIAESIKINSVSGDITVLDNPVKTCSIKTVSGDITCKTFTHCDYSLRSISGDIKVYIATGLEVDVDGQSISGELQSEILLESGSETSQIDGSVVNIRASTISGDFKIARDQ